MLSSWQINDRCTGAQPNYAVDLKSPLASHLLHFTVKASNVVTVQSQWDRKSHSAYSRRGREFLYLLNNTVIYHRVLGNKSVKSS